MQDQGVRLYRNVEKIPPRKPKGSFRVWKAAPFCLGVGGFPRAHLDSLAAGSLNGVGIALPEIGLHLRTVQYRILGFHGW